MNQIDRARAESVGSLIRAARLHNQLTIQDCAEVLGIEPESYLKIEEGAAAPSLPELEVLAMFFGVSMTYFWEGEELKKSSRLDFVGYLALRQAIIGTTLRQFRKEEDKAIEEVAAATGIETEKLIRYESGEEVPFFELEKILKALDRSIKDLTETEQGPLAQHEESLFLMEGFNHLTPELKRFISQPVNQLYLETAVRLSKLDADTLRRVAEGLLEITY